MNLRSGHCLQRFFVVAAIWGLSSFSGAQDVVPPRHPDPIQSYLQPLVANGTLAGAVTLVATKDQVIYLQGVGDRDLANNAPMPPNAMFWIASTSKPMTATALMMLVDEGKVHLDDPVEKYLPEFHGQMVQVSSDASAHGSKTVPASPSSLRLVAATHPILVREILSHTSGLPFKSAAQPGALDTLSLKDSVRSFAAEPLIFQPGTDYKYSNEGLDTAARIIEVVSGMPYEKFMQKRLFKPLGMKDTTFWPNAEQLRRLAETYKVDPKTKKLVEVQINQLTYPLNDTHHRYPMPAGGLFSTATDVSKFCQMILNGGSLHGRQYISAESLHTMTSVQNRGMEKRDYGFGWSISKNGYGHGGAFNNAMEINTSTGRILIFMVQQDGHWGTSEGEAMVPTLEKLSDELVSQSR
jgi:CubicO group peptidase (beta-lactamase class C family)